MSELTLYEILNELVGDEEKNEKFDDQIKEYISNEIKMRVTRQISGPRYKRFKDFLIQNKDNGDLKDLATYFRKRAREFVEENFMQNDEVRHQIKVGYKLVRGLEEFLDKGSYDVERLLLSVLEEKN